jgi:hypothetical protein
LWSKRLTSRVRANASGVPYSGSSGDFEFSSFFSFFEADTFDSWEDGPYFVQKVSGKFV